MMTLNIAHFEYIAKDYKPDE